MSEPAVDELPPLTGLPVQEFPQVRRAVAVNPLAARRRVSEMRVLVCVVLATLATGISVGMAVDGQPSQGSTLAAAALTVLLVWTVLPLVLVRR